MSSEATQMERDAMNDLASFAQKAMRSKRILKILARLQDKGWITLDPFKGEAAITESGKQALERR